LVHPKAFDISHLDLLLSTVALWMECEAASEDVEPVDPQAQSSEELNAEMGRKAFSWIMLH